MTPFLDPIWYPEMVFLVFKSKNLRFSNMDLWVGTNDPIFQGGPKWPLFWDIVDYVDTDLPYTYRKKG